MPNGLEIRVNKHKNIEKRSIWMRLNFMCGGMYLKETVLLLSRKIKLKRVIELTYSVFKTK